MRDRTCLLVITGLLLLLASVAQCLQRDPYQVLGVRRSATQKEIVKAFRTLSRQYHPDKNPSRDATAKFQEIGAAYDYLTDPARQNKPWEWDFSDDASSGRGRSGPYTPYDAFDAFQSTYQFVLDLDPMRLIGIVRTVFDQHTQKHYNMYEKLWHSSVDQAVCQALQAGWKLPRLLEQPLTFLAKQKLVTYKAGGWRAWASSGILLELRFWVARQTPCLQYAGSSSSSSRSETPASKGSGSDGKDAADRASSTFAEPVSDDVERLVELQQQLHTHRKLRQQLLHSSAKAQQRSKGGKPGTSSSSKSRSSSSSSSSGSVVLNGFIADVAQLQLLQGRLLWWALLLASCYLLLHDRQLLLVGAAMVATGLWSLFWGVGGSEGSVEALQALLDANSWTGWLIGVWYTAACASLCLLLPLVLASCVLLLVTYLWAAVSCSSIAMTPCVSSFGLSVWIALQLWIYSGGQLLKGAALAVGVCFVIYKRPSFGTWWVSRLFSPVLFVWHLLRFLALSWGNWLGLTQKSPEAAVRLATAITAHRAQARLKGEQVVQSIPAQKQQQQDGATAEDANGAESPDGSKRGRTAEPSSSPYDTGAATASADPAADFGSAAAYPPKASMGRRATRATYVTVWSIFNGPWWPGTFRPVDLAFSCFWWIRMLGWVLPCRALAVVMIACKLSFVAAAFGMAAAAFGVSGSWLTVQTLVQVVLLRVGAGAGLLWVALSVLDDLARIMDPIKWAKRQQQRRGRLQPSWRQRLHKQRQEQKQRQQQQRQAANGVGRAASSEL